MSKKIHGLRTAIYQVADITEAKVWYSTVFETEPYFDEPFYVGFDIGGFELGLQADETRTEKIESVVAYWGVDDVQQEVDRFVSAGATIAEETQDVGGGIVVAKVKDPWGNIIGLIHNPHFKINA